MISPQHIQERRLDELLRRQLGPRILAAIAGPNVTEIVVNEEGVSGSNPTQGECTNPV